MNVQFNFRLNKFMQIKRGKYLLSYNEFNEIP